MEEPKLKRFHVAAARDALVELWGRGAFEDVLARMPAPERDILRGELPAWVPVRVILAFGYSLWERPIERDRGRYFAWLHRHTDMTIGRVRKFLLSLANPARLFAEAPAMWRADHTAGTLEARIEGKSGVLTLRDHPYVEWPQTRSTMAETFRYVVELSRARDVTETHRLVAPNACEIRLRWR